MPELMDMVHSLSLDEKETLYNDLAVLIKDDKVRLKDRVEKSVDAVKTLVCDIIGVTYDKKSRYREMVTARIIIANVLVQRGLSEETVGRLMGVSHAAIHHYKDNLATWMECPGIYKQEINYYNQTIARL